MKDTGGIESIAEKKAKSIYDEDRTQNINYYGTVFSRSYIECPNCHNKVPATMGYSMCPVCQDIICVTCKQYNLDKLYMAISMDIKSKFGGNIMVTRTINQLHFEDLDPIRFEELILAMVYRMRRWDKLDHFGKKGTDDGIDIRAVEKLENDKENVYYSTFPPVNPV